MNEKAIDAARAKPLQDEFKKIDAIKDRNDLLKEIAHLQTIGVGAVFLFTSGQDAKNSTMVIAQAFQGGLGMPDRDYYTKTDEASKKLRDAIRRARDQDADAAGRAGRKGGGRREEDSGVRNQAGGSRRAPGWSCAIRKRTTTRCRRPSSRG